MKKGDIVYRVVLQDGGSYAVQEREVAAVGDKTIKLAGAFDDMHNKNWSLSALGKYFAPSPAGAVLIFHMHMLSKKTELRKQLADVDRALAWSSEEQRKAVT